MEYKTLYRKYRPNSFELVFGQDNIIKTLKNAINTNKISHAYLFSGPRGTGKTSTAKLFAKAVNCTNNIFGDVCNTCDNCKSFNNNTNPDIIEIDAASNNGVDEIRELKNKISFVPSNSKYKIYIIDEVHMLSMGAFNALLKTLEEPPKYVIFILATTEINKIPLTIISRCQRFDFKPIVKSEMKKCLLQIIKKEKINITDGAIDEIIDCSSGGMRDAINLLDQSNSYVDKEITEEIIENICGNVSKVEILKLFDSMVNCNYKSELDIINNWNNQSKDFSLIIQKMINILNDEIINIKIYNKKELNISEKNIYLITEELYRLEELFKISFDKKIIFETNIIKITSSFEKRYTSIIDNVPRETFEEIENCNVPRETYEYKNKEIIEQIKKIRINNILYKSNKEEKEKLLNNWGKIKDLIFDKKYKKYGSVLIKTQIVAASDEGIIISVNNKSNYDIIENEYDLYKNILNDIFEKKYKIVFIINDIWLELRKEYIEKIKNKTIKYISEKEMLNKIEKNDQIKLFNEFNDLIVIE